MRSAIPGSDGNGYFRISDHGADEEMIDIRIAAKDDIECLMSIRLEMLRVVNDLAEEYEYSDEMINEEKNGAAAKLCGL